MAKAVYSLESLKIGTPGAEGAMGETLAEIAKTTAGTVTFDWPLPNETPITAEEDTNPWVVLKEPQPKKITWESQDMSPEALKVAYGGTVASSKLTPGINFEIPNQSLEIITRKLQGSKAKWSFPLVQLQATVTGNLQKSDLLRLQFTATVLQPSGTDGVSLPEFTYEIVSA